VKDGLRRLGHEVLRGPLLQPFLDGPSFPEQTYAVVQFRRLPTRAAELIERADRQLQIFGTRAAFVKVERGLARQQQAPHADCGVRGLFVKRDKLLDHL
jgi:hypothetical protein